MELLNNRASTKAKIQHFDTMLEQMQVRRSEMSKKLIEAGSDVSIQDEDQFNVDFKSDDCFKVH